MAASARSLRRAAPPVFFTAVALFVLLELTARVYLFGPAGLIPQQLNSIRGLPYTGYLQRSATPRLGFELKPNLDTYFKLVPFRTNSRGLRDQEYPLAKPPNTFRVAVVGSSFAMPAGVAIEDAFHSRLEQQFSASLAPLRVEFINFAVGTYRPEQILASFELRALDYEPDLLLVTATSLSFPHFLPKASRPSVPPPIPLPRLRKSYPVLRSFLFRLISYRVGPPPVSWRERHGFLERHYVQWTVDSQSLSPILPPALAFRAPEKSVTERLSIAARAAGIPIVIARLEFDATRQLIPAEIELAKHARSHGVHYLDTRRWFEGSRASDYWIHPLDPHPDGKANAVFARVIGEFLTAQRLLPAGTPPR